MALSRWGAPNGHERDDSTGASPLWHPVRRDQRVLRLCASAFVALSLVLFHASDLSSGVRAQPSGSAPTQQPSAPPPRQTGRPYSTAPPKKPQGSVPRAPSPVTFTDATAESRLNFRHAASPTSQKYLPETMGGGCALFDYDND